MNPILRQRLVGALVLIALCVVFWPIVFVEPLEQQPIELRPTPERPRIDTSPIAKPLSPAAKIRERVQSPEIDRESQIRADEMTRLVDDESAANLSELSDVDSVEQLELREQAPVIPVLDASGFPQAWVLQVATVSSESRAKTLVGQLVDKGYPAFHVRVSKGASAQWRIQIGPKFEKNSFASMKLEVDRVLKVESMVVRYQQPL
ncbi:MAG: SPOR domain-containing protein [Luminiphilus sp.]|nr:SPOR domain-containing protein [Luminiphilus sp.]